MANFVTNIMSKIYYWIILSGYFYLGLFLGLGIFGFLPSLTTVVSLHLEADNQFQLIRFKDYWKQYKWNFKQAWGDSLFYSIAIALILWMIWFTSQFQGFIFLVSIVIQLGIFVILCLSLLAEAQLRQGIDSDFLNFKKLAFIQFFSFPKTTFSNLVYGFFIMMTLVTMPAIVFFFAVPIWVNLFTRLYQKSYVESGWIDESREYLPE